MRHTYKQKFIENVSYLLKNFSKIPAEHKRALVLIDLDNWSINKEYKFCHWLRYSLDVDYKEKSIDESFDASFTDAVNRLKLDIGLKELQLTEWEMLNVK